MKSVAKFFLRNKALSWLLLGLIMAQFKSSVE